MASCVANMCTKNYKNWITFLQIMVKKFVVFFMTHSVHKYILNTSQKRHLSPNKIKTDYVVTKQTVYFYFSDEEIVLYS